MTWEVFYFVCFLVGFLLSLVTFVTGGSHGHSHGGHVLGGGHSHAGHIGPVRVGGRGSAASWFNLTTVTAFLAWFGGTGYLLTRYSNIWALLGFAISSVSGVGGAAIVFWFLFKFLLAHEQDLNPADYDMVGVLGTVSSPVREGGTGEMIFSREGGRRCAPIRSDDNRIIAKNTEVVVIRFEKGIAYVRPWGELSGDDLNVPLDSHSARTGAGSAQRRDQSEKLN